MLPARSPLNARTEHRRASDFVSSLQHHLQPRNCSRHGQDQWCTGLSSRQGLSSSTTTSASNWLLALATLHPETKFRTVNNNGSRGHGGRTARHCARATGTGDAERQPRRPLSCAPERQPLGDKNLARRLLTSMFFIFNHLYGRSYHQQ
jgi:hypothetical protein